MRKEKDSMGEVSVPDDSYYGAQTQRAKENFNISGKPIPTPIIKALGYIKKSAAIVNNHGSPYDTGMTGDDNYIDVKIPSKESVEIVSSGVSVLDDNSVMMRWYLNGNESNINYFIITAIKTSGIKSVGSCHPASSDGIYSFIDVYNYVCFL